MTRLTDEQVFEEYERKFNEPLRCPPLDYGIRMNTDDLARYARRALEAGRPIAWDEFFVPLPPGCES